MNERITELAKQCASEDHLAIYGSNYAKLAQLIVEECINTLEFHGFDDAIPYIKWMATNKLGVKE